jgi:2-haloacid dehalogenase
MLKKYQTLLFDIDNTLLDFSAAEKVALHRLFEGQNFPLTPEVKARYKTINQGLWTAFEEGKIDRDEVMNTRFSILFKEYGLEVDGVLLEKTYHSYLKEGHQLINGALELIKDLQNQYDLYIVTNGDSETQYKRLHDSGLYPLFKDIFVSEDTGYQKPMKEYFDYVFERIPNLSVENTLIIGDSLSADIKGGQIAGIDTCWFNPEMIPTNPEMIPTYQIQKLDELYRILNLEGKLVGVNQ